MTEVAHLPGTPLRPTDAPLSWGHRRGLFASRSSCGEMRWTLSSHAGRHCRTGCGRKQEQKTEKVRT